MFPLSDSEKSNIFPIFTILIILANIAIFAEELFAPNPDTFILSYSLVPSTVNLAKPLTLLPFFTSMFLHGGFVHIISNMWFLWIFGDNVEGFFGRIWYIIVYLASGLVGNLLQYSLSPTSSIPMLGASGAISGILGAYYILFPRSKIKSIIFIIIFITIIDVPAIIYLFYWFILQLFSGTIALGAASQTGGVAFWAHVGGFATGVIFAKVFSERKNKNYIEGEIID